MDNTEQSSIASRYNSLTSIRETFLERARESSELTLPFLVPPSGHSDATRYPTPYQGIGARGVNNLASKLLLALVPPNAPFFRLQINDFVLKDMEQDKPLKTDVEKALGEVERAVMSEVEMSADRVQIFEALKHLIVSGNCLLVVEDEGTRLFPLERFVIKRDPMGQVLEIITKESLSPKSLPEDVAEVIQADLSGDERTVDIYTHVCKRDKHFDVMQEVKGIIIPDSVGKFPLDKSPYIPLRMSSISQEDYGRGFVEQYLGDLRSLEGLTRAIVEGSSASSKVLFMVSPNGTTRASHLAQSPNGAIVEGSANDVSVLQVNKLGDFRIAYDTMQRIEQRLEHAFLLNASVQRQAERVTAEEIRFMAEALEQSLGGIYSILSQELQLPYITRKMSVMQKGKKLPALPKGMIKPTIVTGLEALGRGNDRTKLVLFLQTLQQNLGAETIGQYVNLSEAIKRLATADGIETKGLIKTEEDLQGEMMAQQQQAQDAQLQQAGQQLAVKGMPQVSPEVIEQAVQNIQT